MEWLERLRYFKAQTNETYRTISDKTGIPQTTIEKLFCGRTKDPKLNMMREIVHCLNRTLDDLVEDKKDRADALSLNQKESQLIQDFRMLSKHGKNYILQTICMAKNTYANNEDNAQPKSTDISDFDNAVDVTEARQSNKQHKN